MIDFDDIKARHRIEDVLGRRGLVIRRASGGFTTKCPFHDGNNKASLFVHAEKQYAKCWTRCGYIGSVIDVVMLLDGASDALAAAEILEGRPLTEAELNKPRVSKAPVSVRLEESVCRRLPKMFRAEELKEAPLHYFEVIAKARGLQWTSIKQAHDAGHVRFCQPQWEFEDRKTGERRLGDKFNCYAVLDVENPLNVQFRRLDANAEGKALPFWWRNGKPVKVMGWLGNQGNWPVGIDSALHHPQATILKVEGTGDFLAGWDIRNLAHDVIPVGIFGAGNRINERALPFYERRNVIIIQQHDAAGKLAAQAWSDQLQPVARTVRIWTPSREGDDLGDYLSSGGDVSAIFKS